MAKIADRHPDMRWIGGTDAGSMLPGANWAFLIHTGETNNFGGLIDTLRARNAWSHIIADPDTGEMVQALNFNRAARSLRSGGSSGKTNAMRVIQVEVKGFASETPFWSPEKNKRFGEMIANVQKVVPFRLAFERQFFGDRSGFTVASEYAKQRMSWLDWYRCDYVVGHQHAPKNSHWDPGAIDTVEIAAGFRRPQIVVPAAPYKPPAFPGFTLREGMVRQEVAVLKVMLTYIGGNLDDHLNLSTPQAAKTFGPGTARDVQTLADLYYKTTHEKRPAVLPKAVGPKLWKFAGQLMILKHAIDHQNRAKAA